MVAGSTAAAVLKATEQQAINITRNKNDMHANFTRRRHTPHFPSVLNIEAQNRTSYSGRLYGLATAVEAAGQAEGLREIPTR